MKTNVWKLVGLGLAMAAAAMAQVSAPEVDPGSATVPIALIGGAILIVRSRMRR